MRPRFKLAPNMSFLLTTMLALPLLYLICLLATRNHYIFAFQISLLLLPSLLLLKKFGLEGAFNRESLAKKIALTTLITVFITAGLNLALNASLPYIPGAEAMQEDMKKLFHPHSSLGVAVDIFSVAVLPAVCEEMFFRGWVQTALAHFLKPWAAIVVSASIFALFHTNLWLLPFYFILASVFGVIYFRTKNLNLAILAHFLNNAVGVILFHTITR